MEKTSRKNKLTIDDYRQSAQMFFQKQMRFKEVQAQFNDLKAQFNNDMKDFFENENIDKSVVFSCDSPNGEKLIVSRVQKSSVEFNPDKLEKILDKKLGKQIIAKRYEVTDIDALITYLKECNVDPKIFKSFLNVSKSVDVQELERLEELGKISMKQIQDCCKVKHQKPYFTINVKKGQDDGETR